MTVVLNVSDSLETLYCSLVPPPTLTGAEPGHHPHLPAKGGVAGFTMYSGYPRAPVCLISSNPLTW